LETTFISTQKTEFQYSAYINKEYQSSPHMQLLRSLKIFAVLLCVILMFVACKKDKEEPPRINPDDEIEIAPPNLKSIQKEVNAASGGYYIALPALYNKTTKKYPLIVFLHGLGQMGNGKEDLDYILNDGIGKILKDKKFPPNIKSGQNNFSFIVVSPQFSKKPSAEEVISIVNEIKSNYRINESRIYLSGLSVGGIVTTNVAAAYPTRFAAIVPMAGVEIDSTVTSKSEQIARAGLPVWVFHNEDDPMISLFFPQQFVSILKSFKPSVEPKLTIFPYYGHDAWTMALDPSYKEEGRNIYEWMLQYSL